jgi:hypothetical protein
MEQTAIDVHNNHADGHPLPLVTPRLRRKRLAGPPVSRARRFTARRFLCLV